MNAWNESIGRRQCLGFAAAAAREFLREGLALGLTQSDLRGAMLAMPELRPAFSDNRLF
ncbi:MULTISPECIES: hypothetical protein [Burkholderiaceae]|uniref:hypothetical protein n=1 Tax=Burkholderiaceae TaxID=119060 RepID=UPI0013894193|nr:MULTISPECIES: hypothetical protein [Burkholderiaceae]